MSRVRLLLVACVVLPLLALIAATWRLSRPAFDEVLRADPIATMTIAPPEQAITLARVASEGRGRVVLVTGSGADGLSVLDLEEAFGRPFDDALDAYRDLGFEALQAAAAAAADGPARVALADLTLPFDPTDPHIAAGANYRAHADEVGVEDGPFLFPKLSSASAWNADVPARGRLDYEAELCAVTLAEHTAERPARLGYVLCNDFTDRWTLMAQIDLDAPMGITGFPDAKGGPGMLPIGPFLVVPADASRFYQDLEIELWVNGRLRQRERAGLMVWAPGEIVSRALADCGVAYTTGRGDVGLTRCEGIPAGTLVLTGTPAGVMFHPLTVWYPGAYLRPGDEVWTATTFLGVLHDRIR